MKRRVDPLLVECPQCGAAIGARCRSGTRRGGLLQRGAHAPRTRRARGADVPESFETFLRRALQQVTEEIVAKRKGRR